MRAAAWLLTAFLMPQATAPGYASPKDVLVALKAAWESRDAAAYLALWRFPSEEVRDSERDFAQGLGQWQLVSLVVEGVGSRASDEGRFRAAVRTFSRSEPKARQDEWIFTLQQSATGGSWMIVGREAVGSVDGLSHLSLDPKGYVAHGRVLHLEDFELHMDDGTLFLSPAAVGPTVIVFVGKGSVRVSPRPPTERHVLQMFCGAPELQEGIQTAFIRVHPADLHRVLTPSTFDPDPRAKERLSEARAVYDAEASHSFVLDADLPGSPWWLFPGIGDALVTFKTAHHGNLTFAVFKEDQESVSLFDREKKRQICLYPPAGRSIHYSEDDGRDATIVRHKIRARIDVDRGTLEGEDTLTLRLLSPTHTVRLRLDEGLHVRSITSGDSSHAFFRVRDQDTLMVSLGAASGTLGDIDLKVLYAGPFHAGSLDSESQSVQPQHQFMETTNPDLPLERSIALTSKDPWYPQLNQNDYALADVTMDLPASQRAVTSGTLVSERVEGGRRIMDYSLTRPGKYLAAVIGHFVDGGQVEESGVSIRAFLAPRSKTEAHQLLQNTQELVQFYTKEFGPCPYPSLNIAVIESENGGGHSPPGMVVLAERPVFLKGALRSDPGNFSDIKTFFLAHEVAHQWWGHGVAGANYHERWLSEGLAQYAAALWVRQKYGEEPFQGVLRRLGDWAFKGNAVGPVSLGYRLSQIGPDPAVFRAIVYDKGAYVIFMLRAIAGDEAVRKALQSLQANHRYQKVGTQDLEAALEVESHMDLRSYLDEWIYGVKLPSVRITRRTSRAGTVYRTTVTLVAKDVPGPIPVEVSLETDGGEKDAKITLADKPSSWTVETQSAPKKLKVNGDRALLLRVENAETS